jgi:hypothetical protein
MALFSAMLSSAMRPFIPAICGDVLATQRSLDFDIVRVCG